MKHRKFQKKNRKKLKSVDPFNAKGKSQEIHKRNWGVNHAPKLDEIDVQSVPRSSREVGLLIKETASRSAEKRPKFNQRNKNISEVDELAGAAGVKRKRFETEAHLMYRLNNVTHARVQEELLKVRYNLAGRDEREIAKDVQLAEEESKSKKTKHKKVPDISTKVSKREGTSSSEQVSKNKDANKPGGQVQACTEQEPKSRSKPDRKKRRKMLQSQTRDHEDKELMLNARELIPFGERVDAPPVFKSIQRKEQLRAGFAKAGGKDLLLQELVLPKANRATNDNKIEANTLDSRDACTDLMEERRRVINAYRGLKSSKR